MAPHSSILAWKIPWTEEPGRLQSMGSWRMGHEWATSLSLFTFMGEGNGNPLQSSCLENPRDGAAWWAAICWVTQSQTRRKKLSSSSRFLVIDSSLLVDFPQPWSCWQFAVWVLFYRRCGPCRQELRVMRVWASLGVLGESPNPNTTVIHGIFRILGGEKEFVFVV